MLLHQQDFHVGPVLGVVAPGSEVEQDGQQGISGLVQCVRYVNGARVRIAEGVQNCHLISRAPRVALAVPCRSCLRAPLMSGSRRPRPICRLGGQQANRGGRQTGIIALQVDGQFPFVAVVRTLNGELLLL